MESANKQHETKASRLCFYVVGLSGSIVNVLYRHGPTAGTTSSRKPFPTAAAAAAVAGSSLFVTWLLFLPQVQALRVAQAELKSLKPDRVGYSHCANAVDTEESANMVTHSLRSVCCCRRVCTSRKEPSCSKAASLQPQRLSTVSAHAGSAPRLSPICRQPCPASHLTLSPTMAVFVADKLKDLQQQQQD
jgi:hypothetical protein